MFGWGVRPREDSITKKLPFPGAFSTKMAGYVRVSTNTYAYGIRRGFALLVTDVAL